MNDSLRDCIQIPELTPEDLARFYSKIKKIDNCWIWTSNKSHNGYGLFKIGRVNYRAHRIALQLSGFILEPKMVTDHLCLNPACVNPDHIEQVTHKENTLRGESFSAKNSKKTHCPKGHKYDKVNSRGSRLCSICDCICKTNWARRHSRQLKMSV